MLNINMHTIPSSLTNKVLDSEVEDLVVFIVHSIGSVLAVFQQSKIEDQSFNQK